MHPSEVTIVIPAAGASKRFGTRDKLEMRWGGTSVLQTVVDQAGRVGALEVLVVGRLDGRRAPAHCRMVRNPDPGRGMASSISLGVESASHEAGGFLIWPADMPMIPSSAALAVIDQGATGTAVRPWFEGIPGHPVFFGAGFRSRLEHLPDGPGARALLEVVDGLEWPDDTVVADLDTQADYHRLVPHA